MTRVLSFLTSWVRLSLLTRPWARSRSRAADWISNSGCPAATWSPTLHVLLGDGAGVVGADRVVLGDQGRGLARDLAVVGVDDHGQAGGQDDHREQARVRGRFAYARSCQILQGICGSGLRRTRGGHPM